MAQMAEIVRALRERSGREAGFTLVELLAVMLILGVLAAISLPAFMNQSDKAEDAQAKAEARTARTAMEVYETGNEGGYEDATVAILVGLEPALSQASSEGRLSVSSDASGYTVEVDSPNQPTSQHFRVVRGGGGTVFTCDVAGTDGCPSGGSWGN